MGICEGDEFTCSLSLKLNTCSQSSQLTEPLLNDPVVKGGISVCELIFNYKKKKKAQIGNN